MKSKKGKNNMWFCIIIGILAVLCFIYFVSIQFFTGYGSRFHFIWLLLSIIFAVVFFSYKTGFVYKVPVWIKRSGFICVIMGITIFIAAEAFILSGFVQKSQNNIDYLIVLGAQLKPSGPSKVLQYRLDKAIEYLEKNSDTKVIVSGGQGKNEPDTEAEGMKQYLVKKGIKEDRILKEDLSASTYENLKFSSRFVNMQEDLVGIVTNDFHVFRATQIAKKAGYQNVCGIPAKSYLPLWINNMTREAVAVVKDWLLGNL